MTCESHEHMRCEIEGKFLGEACFLPIPAFESFDSLKARTLSNNQSQSN